MDANLMNISKVETFFDTLLRGKVSENVFFTNLPSAIKQEWSDMVLVDIPNAISNMNAYGSGIVLVYLYAIPKHAGAKDVPKLSRMEQTLNECIKNSNDGHYRISIIGNYSDYDGQRNLFCNIVEINLTII